MAVVAETGELTPRNPATLEVVGRVRVTPPEGVQEAVTEARLAQEAWAKTPIADRCALLERVWRVLLAHDDEVVATIVAETGKPVLEAAAHDLLIAIENVRWVAGDGARALRPVRLRPAPIYLKHKRSTIVREPLGVVAVLAPSNLPLAIPLSQVAAIVAAGNGCVVKPSELTPLTGAWIERVFAEAGAPAGLVRVVQGGADVGDALLGAHGVAKVIFTGSATTGRAVAVAAAERGVPVTLELGGKDPMLVLDDADLERAVEGALFASFANCGQVCAGVERIYVDRSLFEPFVEALAQRAGGLRVGRGDDPATDVGPLMSEAARDRVERLVEGAVSDGAEVRAGGRRADVGLPGWFYEPTVLTKTGIDDEEIFGPVVTVAPFAGDADAVRFANDTAFGLGASVWTRNRDRFAALAARIDAGSVWMNDHAYSYGSANAPWGGWKASGIGATHGTDGLLDLTRPKLVDVDGGRLDAPWWFPYGERATEAFRDLPHALYGRGLWRRRRSLVELGRRYFR